MDPNGPIDDEITFDFFGFEFDFEDDASDSEGQGSVAELQASSEDQSAKNGPPIRSDDQALSHAARDLSSSVDSSPRDTSVKRKRDAPVSSDQLQTSKKQRNNAVLSSSAAAASTTATSPSQQKQKKKLLKKKGKRVEATPARPNPPPILPLDVRRTYPKLFLNAFNSCDPVRLKEVLDKHAVDDLVAIHRYEGIENPHGRKYTRLKGTRVMDIRYAAAKNDEVLQMKLAHGTSFVTDQSSLLDQLAAERTARDAVALSSSSATATAESASSQSLANSVGRYFQKGADALIIENTDNHASFYVDKQPLANRIQLRYRGTLIIYLNEHNQVHKYEFVYISMEEVEARQQQSEPQKEQQSSTSTEPASAIPPSTSSST